MATNSNIEWTDATWNPVVGCTKVSEGCRNCYAMTMSKRRSLAWVVVHWAFVKRPDVIMLENVQEFEQWGLIDAKGKPIRDGRGGIESSAEAVELFRQFLARQGIGRPVALLGRIQELRGKNLGCWCKLCEKHKHGKPVGEQCPDCAPCHVDVLLEIANPQGA